MRSRSIGAAASFLPLEGEDRGGGVSPRSSNGSCPRSTSFEYRWRDVADGGVSAFRVVEALDEVEDCEFGFGGCTESRAVEKLALERRKEALAHGIVVAVTNGAHRRTNAVFATPPTKLDRRVLAALIRMMDHTMLWTTASERHRKRIEHDLRR